MKSTLTFAHEANARQFGLGDVLSTGDIVTGIERYRVHCRPATRFWRTVMWIRTAPRRAWWYVACRAYDLRDAVVGLFR